MITRLAATVLTGALLFGQGASVLFASLCPHLRSRTVSCTTETPEPEVSHEHLNHAEMDLAASETIFDEAIESKVASTAVILSRSTESCPHCKMHTRSYSITAAFAQSETTWRASRLNTTLVRAPITWQHVSVIANSVSRAHEPPGSNLLRHVLINVFRI